MRTSMPVNDSPTDGYPSRSLSTGDKVSWELARRVSRSVQDIAARMIRTDLPSEGRTVLPRARALD